MIPCFAGLPFMPLSQKKLTQLENDMEFMNVFEEHVNLSLATFEWELPDTVDARMLETSLLYYGRAMIANVGGAYLALGCTNGAGVNINRYPTSAWGFGFNGFNKEFKAYIEGASDSATLSKGSDGMRAPGAPECVICYDNLTGYPLINTIYMNSKRLSDIIRATDVVVKTMKRPYFIQCDQQQKTTIEAILQAIDDNKPAIIAAKGLTPDSFKVIPTNVDPDTLPALWSQYENIQARLLEKLGINSNASQDKKERLLVGEINANNQLTDSSIGKRLAMREKFCKQVKDCFGLDISVKVRDYNDIAGMDSQARYGGYVPGDTDNGGGAEGD